MTKAFQRDVTREAASATGTLLSPRSTRPGRFNDVPAIRPCPCAGGCARCTAGPSDEREAREGARRTTSTALGKPGDRSDTGDTKVAKALAGIGVGAPLDAGLAAELGPRFGFDFSRVRVHTDAEAARSAASLNAKAFTAGRDIVFAAGQYAPKQPFGRRLVAHELAHVVQHGGRDRVDVAPKLGARGDAVERAAAMSARAVLQGESARPARVPRAVVQCWYGEEPDDVFLDPTRAVDGADAAAILSSLRGSQAWEAERVVRLPLQDGSSGLFIVSRSRNPSAMAITVQQEVASVVTDGSQEIGPIVRFALNHPSYARVLGFRVLHENGRVTRLVTPTPETFNAIRTQLLNDPVMREFAPTASMREVSGRVTLSDFSRLLLTRQIPVTLRTQQRGGDEYFHDITSHLSIAMLGPATSEFLEGVHLYYQSMLDAIDHHAADPRVRSWARYAVLDAVEANAETLERASTFLLTDLAGHRDPGEMQSRLEWLWRTFANVDQLRTAARSGNTARSSIAAARARNWLPQGEREFPALARTTRQRPGPPLAPEEAQRLEQELRSVLQSAVEDAEPAYEELARLNANRESAVRSDAGLMLQTFGDSPAFLAAVRATEGADSEPPPTSGTPAPTAASRLRVRPLAEARSRASAPGETGRTARLEVPEPFGVRAEQPLTTSSVGGVGVPGVIAAGVLALLELLRVIMAPIGDAIGNQRQRRERFEEELMLWDLWGADPHVALWLEAEHRAVPLSAAQPRIASDGLRRFWSGYMHFEHRQQALGAVEAVQGFFSPIFGFVEDIDIEGLRRGFREGMHRYADLAAFLVVTERLGVVEHREDRYVARVNRGAREYDLTDIITETRQRLARTLPTAGPQDRRLAPNAVISCRSDGGFVEDAWSHFGPNPIVRPEGPEVGPSLMGFWFDTKVLVRPLNGDAQLGVGVATYTMYRSIEDMRESLDNYVIPETEVRRSGNLFSFTTRAHAESGVTTYYRRGTSTMCVGELRQFWVNADDLLPVPHTSEQQTRHRR